MTKTTIPRPLGPEAHQLDLHELARLGVEAGEGLVHQQDVGIGGERPRQRHALLHAARQLVRIGVGEAGEPDQREVAVHALASLLPGHAVERQAEADVVAHASARG